MVRLNYWGVVKWYHRGLWSLYSRFEPWLPSKFEIGLASEEYIKKPNKRESGNSGEQEIVDLVPCPNCGKQLIKLPPNYPLYDVQCTGCSFRAQVKTNQSKPKSIVFGAGWQIMNKVLKSGYMTPPLFLNFKWMEKGKTKREIRFYSFVPKKNYSFTGPESPNFPYLTFLPDWRHIRCFSLKFKTLILRESFQLLIQKLTYNIIVNYHDGDSCD